MGSGHIGPFRLPGRTALGGVLAVGVLSGAAQAADARLDARYDVRLAMLPVNFATATLKGTFPESGRYTLDIGARGIGFGFSGKTVGTRTARELRPYSVAIDTEDSDDDKRSIRLSMLGGTVRSESVEPPVPYREDRVPMTRDHRRDVIDPLSAMVIPISDTKKLDEACDRKLPIFEGTERFDITLTYLRTETVKTQRGYSGPVAVCRARYKAVSGHREGRKQIKYMEDNRTIEVWLAPIGDAKLVAPWRVSLSTVMGTLIVEASEFTARGGDTADAGTSRTGTAD